MSAGWVLLHRSVWESRDFKPEPFSEREAFIWSISQAAHAPHKQWFNGVRIAVNRGEFATSTRKLAAIFKWSEKRVRSFIGRMETGGNWTHHSPHLSPHHATIISICNYARFQKPGRKADAPIAAPKGAVETHPGRTEDAQQKEGIKNSNEGKRIEAEATPLLAPSVALPFGDAVEAWTQAAALKNWTPRKPTLSDKRRKGLGKILTAHGLEGWVLAIQRAIDSPLLGGPDPPAWFNFEFVCDPNKFLKLSEGNYDKPFSSGRSELRSSTWLEARAELSALQRTG